MAAERKDTMIWGRAPAALVARVDHVVRNTEIPALSTRSGAIRDALEAWLPGQEKQIKDKLGGTPQKARP